MIASINGRIRLLTEGSCSYAMIDIDRNDVPLFLSYVTALELHRIGILTITDGKNRLHLRHDRGLHFELSGDATLEGRFSDLQTEIIKCCYVDVILGSCLHYDHIDLEFPECDLTFGITPAPHVGGRS